MRQFPSPRASGFRYNRRVASTDVLLEKSDIPFTPAQLDAIERLIDRRTNAVADFTRHPLAVVVVAAFLGALGWLVLEVKANSEATSLLEARVKQVEVNQNEIVRLVTGLAQRQNEIIENQKMMSGKLDRVLADG